MNQAFTKYCRMGGIKKGRTPDICPLNQQEARGLEESILEEGLPQSEVKRVRYPRWYGIE